MDQKVIKVGKSIAVVLPAKEAREEGFSAGKPVFVERKDGRFVIELKEPLQKTKSAELVAWAEEAVERYRPALEALKDK